MFEDPTVIKNNIINLKMENSDSRRNSANFGGNRDSGGSGDVDYENLLINQKYHSGENLTRSNSEMKNS